MIRNWIARFLAGRREYQWHPKQGPSVLVSEMGDEHLLNALRMVEERIVVWAALRSEAARRGLKPKAVRPLKEVPDWYPVDEAL